MDEPWLPVESTPSVLTALLRKLGVPAPWGISDVFGLDDELLAMTPEPVAGVILLFPSDCISSERRAELRERRAEQAPASTFLVQQHDGASDACGTIALIHCVGNSPVTLSAESPVGAFLARARELPDPSARGRALVQADAVRTLSNAAAASGETQGAGTDDNQGQHFVAFCNVEGQLVELDGRTIGHDGQAFPVVHGPTSAHTLLRDAAAVIKTDFMARDPANLRFSVLAFCSLED